MVCYGLSVLFFSEKLLLAYTLRLCLPENAYTVIDIFI